MDEARRVRIYAFVAALLLLLNAGILAALFAPTRSLTVSFLDVGQGDAILIQGPTGRTLLVDGGPDRSVLRRLSAVLPPWKRRIDAVIETHPDKDHIGGLGDVIARYDVRTFLEPGIPDETAAARQLSAAVGLEPGLTHLVARRGMRIHLGGGAYADVLFPDRDESHQTATNDGSVTLRLVYGATSFLLSGDLPSPYEDYLVGLDGANLDSDVLKAGHHGSKYSTDALWLAAVTPTYVVVSAGKGNPYGHPDQGVLERIRNAGATVLSTIDEGTITFASTGTTLTRRGSGLIP